MIKMMLKVVIIVMITKIMVMTIIIMIITIIIIIIVIIIIIMIRNIEITWTAIDLNPHGYAFVPTHWSNSNIACSDWLAYVVKDYGLSVCISLEDLFKVFRISEKRALNHNIEHYERPQTPPPPPQTMKLSGRGNITFPFSVTLFSQKF